MKIRVIVCLLTTIFFAGLHTPIWAHEPITLNLPQCDDFWINTAGDHADNCSENEGLGGCNGIVGNMTNLGPIPDGQIFCNDHRILACDRVSKIDANTFQQFACTTVPIKLNLDGVDTWVSPGIGLPTIWRVANSCSEAQPDEFCELRGCDWNIPDSNPFDSNGCPPVIARNYPLCNCLPPTCGDSIVSSDEECDDGNHVNGDGCDSNCNQECGTISRDPGAIKYLSSGIDIFKAHGRISENISTDRVRVRILNDTETAYDTTFFVFQKSYWFIAKGTGFSFKIGGKRNGAMFYLFDKRSLINIFSPNMSIRLDINGKCFKHLPAWKKRTYGWSYIN